MTWGSASLSGCGPPSAHSPGVAPVPVVRPQYRVAEHGTGLRGERESVRADTCAEVACRPSDTSRSTPTGLGEKAPEGRPFAARTQAVRRRPRAAVLSDLPARAPVLQRLGDDDDGSSRCATEPAFSGRPLDSRYERSLTGGPSTGR